MFATVSFSVDRQVPRVICQDRLREHTTCDYALLTMHYRGLNYNVKYELIRHAGNQSTLDGMIRLAIEVNDALCKRFMEKRPTGHIRR